MQSVRLTIGMVMACASLWAGVARAQELSVKAGPTAAAPTEIAEPVRALLGDASVTVARGANMLEFWWVKALPLESAPSGTPAWSNVADGSIVGALRIAKPLTDIRGLPIKPGVYTLRYTLQPQDGDHMGVSPYREFLLVAPAAEDMSAAPAGYKGAVALAKKTFGKSHPAALSLDPPASTATPGSIVTNDAGHTSVVFSVPAAAGGASKGSLTFGLMLVGTIEHQM